MAKDNPILDMGLFNMMQPNKYIDPAFRDKPLQLPGFYTGEQGHTGDMPPTDAMGNPIQSFVDANNRAQTDYQKQLADYNANKPAQGTTLNSNPVSSGTDNSALQNYIASQNGVMQGMPSNLNQGGFASGNTVDSNAAAAQYRNNAIQMDVLKRQQAQQPAAQGGPPSPPNTRQYYLNALADPGKVTTPGATVAPSNPLGQPSVMDAFLKANPGGGTTVAGGTGGGGYSNTGFFSTLNKLRSA